jgi:rubrerythrin
MSEGAYLNEHEGSSLTSRRKFLAGSAAALAGGTLMAVPGVASAHNPPEPPTDIDMLNYALTLEHLEATFYVRGLRRFGEQDFRTSNLFRGSGNLLRPTVYENFRRIRNHEVKHVDKLKDVIESLGGEPVPEAEYNFNKTAFTSVEKFIAVAQVLENTGVKAYDGAIAHIERAALLTAGATIATVEARHASYLNLINGDIPFPRAFDEAVAPQTICEAVQAGFITSPPDARYGPYVSLTAFCNRLPMRPTPG